jgi:hypothetical protein
LSREEQTFPARGLSMLPAIPPRSEVTVIRADTVGIRPGDVIGYPGMSEGLVLHRVLRTRDDGHGFRFVVRGDSQVCSEEVPSTAVAYRAIRVKYGPLSYSTDGILGSAVAHLAVRRGVVWSATIRAARASVRLVVAVKAVFRAVG